MGVIIFIVITTGESSCTSTVVFANDWCTGFFHFFLTLKSTVEGSLADKIDEEEKDQIKEALEAGQDFLNNNPEATAEEIKEKQKEMEETCAPIISKHYGAGAGGFSGGNDDDDDDDSHDEL
jgi:hypothetical protein